MTSLVSVPLWVLLLLILFAVSALLDRILVPSVRWVLRRRVNRVLEEFNERLQIRVQPFKLTKRQVLIDRLVYDPEVLAAAEAFAQSEEMPREVALETVGRYAREIVPSFNAYLYFRFGYWLSRTIAKTLYRVRLGYSDEESLRQVSPDSTVVFVMNHRSNFDYILVSYLVAERTALSYAVGEWARIWPLETLIRSMGAYFVRRRSRNDLYRKVLSRYVAMSTQQGVTQAVFPEGGLSRDGLMQAPKLGLLDYMVRAFEPDGPRDIVMVPVGINYDRVLEDRTLLLDLDPDADRKTGLQALATTRTFFGHHRWLALRGGWYRVGYASVNFGTPLSIGSYLAGRGLDPRELERSERFALVAELADELMGRVQRMVPVLPVALVASVIAANPDGAWSELELKAAVQELIDEYEERGRKVYIPRWDREYAIEVGVRMLTLRHILIEDEGLYRVATGEMALVRYYANSLGA